MRRCALFVVACLAAGAAATPASSATVNCGSQNLQTKINGASAGATLKVKGTCVGTFTISKSLTLVGNPSATLDAQQQGTTLTITGTPNVHLAHLTITGGLEQPSGFVTSGGGIDHAGGALTLNSVTVADNVVFGAPNAQGGGIYSAGGPLVVNRSAIVRNTLSATRGDPGSTLTFGAGIYSGGRLTITGSRVSSNEASAVSTAPADIATWAAAVGTGVYAGATAPLVITKSHFDGNRGSASALSRAEIDGVAFEDAADGSKVVVKRSTISGNVGSATSTGANVQIFGAMAEVSVGSARLEVTRTTFAHNRVWAHGGGLGASVSGGALDITAVKSTLDHVRFIDNSSVAEDGRDCTLFGAAVQLESGSGPLTIKHSSLLQNSGMCSSGTQAARVYGGGVMNLGTAKITVSQSTLAQNRLDATSTGADADVRGGGIFTIGALAMSRSTVSGNDMRAKAPGTSQVIAHGAGLDLGYAGFSNFSLVNSTIAGNVARAKPGAAVIAALGGGIYAAPVELTITASTIARNSVVGPGSGNHGGGLYQATGTVTLRNTILALNSSPNAANGPNCFGSVGSGGHNLLGNPTGCGFTSVGSDKVGKNPKLGPLGSNGGPTRTLALLGGSPAIDAIPRSACRVGIDQRGVKRPQNGRCDIGSFERK
jgi:hypothetical protein